ncbi:MAG: dockerin type I repeat-containing protein, partial [Armatimonadetes bacterium]|nr:dockerin type I repeat-containing protein [Armatimonadota bacterium]
VQFGKENVIAILAHNGTGDFGITQQERTVRLRIEPGAVTPPVGCKGNVNTDKDINITDAVAMLTHIVSGGDVTKGALTGDALQNADIDGQGGVNVQDVVLLLQAIVGLEPGKAAVNNPTLKCP